MNFHRRLKVGLARIRVAIAGVGNCASAIIQGVHYYEERESEAGLTYGRSGGETPRFIWVWAGLCLPPQELGKGIVGAGPAEPEKNPARLYRPPPGGTP